MVGTDVHQLDPVRFVHRRLQHRFTVEFMTMLPFSVVNAKMTAGALRPCLETGCGAARPVSLTVRPRPKPCSTVMSYLPTLRLNPGIRWQLHASALGARTEIAMVKSRSAINCLLCDHLFYPTATLRQLPVLHAIFAPPQGDRPWDSGKTRFRQPTTTTQVQSAKERPSCQTRPMNSERSSTNGALTLVSRSHRYLFNQPHGTFPQLLRVAP
jgi:hypothetical protein